MSTLLAYTFSTAIVEPPTGNQLRLNTTDAAPASKLWVRWTTTDGIDAYYALQTLPLDSTLYLQDKSNHTQSVAYTTTAAPLDKGSYSEIAITLETPVGGAPFSNSQAVVLLLQRPADVAPGPLPPNAQLVSLDQAKDHLRLAFAAGDAREADLQLKLNTAEAAILDYCNTTQTWREVTTTWDSNTAPLQVTAAILLLTGELWRFRGDDASPEMPLRDPLTDFSPQICGLLRRTRDPVLA